MSDRVWLITRKFPNEELFGLTNQVRRCAISIPSNIAEGAGRNTAKDFGRFLSIALGSIAELETQALIAKDLGFVELTDYDKFQNELVVIRKMTVGLKKSLKL